MAEWALFEGKKKKFIENIPEFEGRDCGSLVGEVATEDWPNSWEHDASHRMNKTPGLASPTCLPPDAIKSS